MTGALGVAIVGCGLIGRKRAAALAGQRLVACADLELGRAAALAASVPGAAALLRWQDAVAHPDVNVVVVATTNDALAPITRAALEAGRHVLVEKPAARTAAELNPLIDLAADRGLLVRVGFNHRFHPALRQAWTIVDSGALGEMMFVRGRYGHGGRLGYEKEWRADPAKSGGGELIDQGVHLIDLAGWFLGPFVRVDGFAATMFWPMPVDDNAFLTLRTATGQTAFLHVSCTEWKNLFSLEIYGRDGKLAIDGLGRSYGVERLTWYRMKPEMGPPEVETWEYPGDDGSWSAEFAEFVEDIRRGREPAASLREARGVLQVVEEIYRRSGYAFGGSRATDHEPRP
jgi:predicted dehydrogenase